MMHPIHVPRQRWLLAPCLALAALIASFAWWQAGKAAWQPPPALRPTLPETASHAIVVNAQAHIQHAQARPLLWVSRRPLQQDAIITPSEVTDDLGNARLVAVFESGNFQRVALLLKADGSQLTITSQSQPWRIEAFNGQRAVFVSNTNQRLERLLEAGPPPPKPAPSAQPRQRQPQPSPPPPPQFRQTPAQPPRT